MKNIFKASPKTSVIISLSILILIGAWFKNTYSDNKIQLSSIIKPNKIASYAIESQDNVLLNKTFTTNIVLDTNGNSVNAIGMQLFYQIDSLKVISINTTESFCQFYPEKKINDTLGTISLSCGSPSPGFTGKNTVIKIEFQPIKIGTTTLTIDDVSKILLSDGKGTNILSEYPQKKINVLNNL